MNREHFYTKSKMYFVSWAKEITIQDLFRVALFLLAFFIGMKSSFQSRLSKIISAFNQNSQKEIDQTFKMTVQKKDLRTLNRLFILFSIISISTLLFQIISRKSLWNLFKKEGIVFVPIETLFFCIGLVTVFLIRTFISKKLVSTEEFLKGMRWNKTSFVDSIFLALGEKRSGFLTQAIKENLALTDNQLRKKLAKADEEHNLQKFYLKELKSKTQVYKSIIEKIIKFEWCESCYPPQIETNTSFFARDIISENQGENLSSDIHKNNSLAECKSNCLKKFMSLKGVLSEQFTFLSLINI